MVPPQVQTLAEFLGTAPVPAGELPPEPSLVNIAGDVKAFAEAVLNSHEFRQYIVHGLTLGNIPSAILSRIMDAAGWPAAQPKRIEVSGKDGKPIETIAEVRRTIVHAPTTQMEAAVAAAAVVH